MKEKARIRKRFSNSLFTVCSAIGFGLLVLGLYHFALNGWWRWDDTQILKQALSQTPVEFFFSPEAYQVLSLKNFTPWLIFSFDMDLQFLGLDPARFYARQLMDLWLAQATFQRFLKGTASGPISQLYKGTRGSLTLSVGFMR